MAVTLTEAAARHVTRYLTKRGQGVGVRLGVKTTGCSGLAYKLEYADEQAPVASEMLLALKDSIPEIRTIETGRDFKHSERSFDLALIVTFDSKEDLEIYDRHPEHEKARAYIKAHRTATATVDFEF